MAGHRLLGLSIAFAVAWLPLAPREHVHEGDEHGHDHAVVHRHASEHLLTAEAHLRGVLEDDDDGPALTLDSVSAPPSGHWAVERPIDTASTLPIPPLARTFQRSRDYVEHLIHGPPRGPTGLRAPPVSSRL